MIYLNFLDVRVLLDNDSLLKDGVSAAVEQYNKDQFTSVRIPNSEYQALVTEHNSLGPGRFFDPRTKQSFKYDHYRREPSEFQVNFSFYFVAAWQRRRDRACKS